MRAGRGLRASRGWREGHTENLDQEPDPHASRSDPPERNPTEIRKSDPTRNPTQIKSPTQPIFEIHGPFLRYTGQFRDTVQNRVSDSGRIGF